MDSAQTLSLKQVTLTKVFNLLLNENHKYEKLRSRSLVFSPEFGAPDCEQWDQVELSLKVKVFLLELPESLKEKLTSFIKPFLSQLEAWLQFHDNYCNFPVKLPTAIFWTPQCTIDKKKMAELIVQDQNLDVCKRFEIACIYCFEDHIYSLWPEVPKESFKDLESGGDSVRKSLYLLFWMHFLEDTLADFHYIMKSYCGKDTVTPYEFAFQVSANSVNEIACRYFFQKLTSEEETNILVKISESGKAGRFQFHYFLRDYYVDLLQFMISVMNEKQQLKLLATQPELILEWLLFGQRRDLLPKISQCFWDIFQPYHYYYMFREFRERIFKRRKDFDYQMIFRMVWQQIPNSQKKNVIFYNDSASAFTKYFPILANENVMLILSDVIAIIGVEFSKGIRIYESLICYNRWDLFEFFVKNCAFSKDKDMLINFKEYISKYICTTNIEDLLMLYRIMGNCIQECGKKQNTDKDDRSLKKHCNEKL